MNTLIVMDMQQGVVNSPQPKYNKAQVIANIQHLVKAVRETQGKVIWVQHDNDDVFKPGCDNWALIPEMPVEPGDITVGKTACDAFVHSALSEHLSLDDTTIICGCATDFCMDATIKAGAARGFAFVIPTDAHSTSDREHMDAGVLIQHYHFVWQNLIVPGVSLSLPTTLECIESLTSTSA